MRLIAAAHSGVAAHAAAAGGGRHSFAGGTGARGEGGILLRQFLLGALISRICCRRLRRGIRKWAYCAYYLPRPARLSKGRIRSSDCRPNRTKCGEKVCMRAAGSASLSRSLLWPEISPKKAWGYYCCHEYQPMQYRLVRAGCSPSPAERYVFPPHFRDIVFDAALRLRTGFLEFRFGRRGESDPPGSQHREFFRC